MDLSLRLRAVAELVTPALRAADIGCDHGYVSIWLVRQGICPRVIAMDVNRGPLRRAQENIASYAVADYIETRLSNGAAELRENEADSLILAGMGGRLMLRILSESSRVTETAAEWIMQPQSEVGMVRRCLRLKGHHIVQENMMKEDGKYYPMFRVIPNGIQAQAIEEDIRTQACDRYGALLLQQKHPVLQEYLRLEKQKLEDIMERLGPVKTQGTRDEPDAPAGQKSGTDRSTQHRQALKREVEIIDCALSCYDAEEDGDNL